MQDFSFPARSCCVIVPPERPKVLEQRDEVRRGSSEAKLRVVGVVKSVPDHPAVSKSEEVQAERKKVIKLNGNRSKAVGVAG